MSRARYYGTISRGYKFHARGELVIAGARFHFQFTIIFSASEDACAHQPSAGEFRSTHPCAPVRPLRRVERRSLRKVRQRFVHRQSRRRRRVAVESACVQALVESFVRLRIKRDMQIGEQLPIVGRTSPGQRPREGVAVGASTAHNVVRDIGLIQNPALGKIHHRLRLVGRQPMVGAEILDDRFRLHGSQRNAVQANHSLQCFLPLLRRSALPGNAQQISLGVLGVAAATFGDHQRVNNRDAFFRRRSARLAICGQAHEGCHQTSHVSAL